MSRLHWIVLSVACSGLLGSGGCGEARNSAAVTGKVTVKGQALADIGVSFEPQGSGAGRGSFGRTDGTGQYSLTFVDNDQPGALIGKHRVTFRDLAAAAAQESDAGNLPKQTIRFPAKYMSEGLEFEVKAGSNQADFDLK